MGISHFSGLFLLLCIGAGGALLTLAGEHGFYRLVLPHIRRRQNLKYWLHTSQKIHRALNMTYEDVKRQRAEKEKSCNLQKTQTSPGPPGPLGPPNAPTSGASAQGNISSKDAPAATIEARDFRRVQFSLETLNTRRLLARLASSDTKGGGDKSNSREPAKPRVGEINSLYENGGPAASFASLVLSRTTSSSARPSAPPPVSKAPPTMSKATPPAFKAPPPVSKTPPTVYVAPTTAVITTAPVSLAPPTPAPPKPGELQELQEQIEQMREKLRAALARRAEIQTTLTKPIGMVDNSPPPVIMTTKENLPTVLPAVSAPPAPVSAPPAPVSAPPALSPSKKSVTTMTNPPHKVLSKVPPLRSKLANQRR